ncbi:hypothetical protein LOTGIDRAFT_152128 [Lottia gigantea]|uniref:Uncharacterized protein n=1 Tax=Lottia gigantea TaxID=225164 RepID=V4B4A7_LOTGI|nr:hypothetical protein LOTGIDRAFT_152128 [Lottia gigantea]ESP05298.1 hypothetical protein LOTGIDRAFT_152128 [Lottia gigantea]
MDELQRNGEFCSRLKQLSPDMRKLFLETVSELYEQESELIIDIIEDCRYEMQQTALSYKDDSDQLRAASRMLAERRFENERTKSRLSSSSRMSGISNGDENSINIREYKRNKKLGITGSERSPTSMSAGTLADYCRSPVPARALRNGTQSLPGTPPLPKSLEEETKAILRNLDKADAQRAEERARQAERLEQRREARRLRQQERTARAMELLDEALKMDKLVTKDKQRQEAKLREKLEELKRRKGLTPTPLPPINQLTEVEN